MNVNDCGGRFYKTNYKKISEYILTVDSLHGGYGLSKGRKCYPTFPACWDLFRDPYYLDKRRQLELV